MKREENPFFSLILGVLFLCGSLSVGLAALPDFNQLKILSLSHAIEVGPQVEPDPFYPEYLSLSYQIRVQIQIERPADWDSSLFDLPDAVTSYIGRTILDLYQKDGQKEERLASMRVRCELHPIWVTGDKELVEEPSRISYYVPTHLLERGLRGQMTPIEMLERGRAHFRALLRQQGGVR